MKIYHKVENKKKKNIALKVSTIEEEVEEDNSSVGDEDLTLITRKFKKSMNGEKYKRKRFTLREESQKKENLSNRHKDK